jgi:RimJ/RimL family protein N-acetyltransferase
MTTSSAPAACRLGRGDAAQLAALLDRDPIGNAYLRSELSLGMDGGDWWGVFDGAGLQGAVLGGSLAWPYIPDPEAAAGLAEALAGTSAPRMIVGPRESVLALHRAFSPPRYARERRDPQPLLAVTRERLVARSPSPVRLATRRDLDELVVTSAAMHREEMGSDPLSAGAASWRARMASLVDRGWAWVWTDRGKIIFKAELSAWNPDVVQIQGVYTVPQHRFQGIATEGLSTVCASLLSQVSMCSLYVNHYNAVAQGVYRKLGFEPAGAFATVFY